MRILTLTTLYPNSVQIRNGIFVRERLRKLVEATGMDATVIAPVPWFPLDSPRFGQYADFARVPRVEDDEGRAVYHPRFLVVPRISEVFMPLTYFRAVRGLIHREGLDFDLIDAHFAFPDGVAAALLARRLGKPSVLTVRGSDINLIARERIAGRWIRWCLGQQAAIVTVSEALTEGVRRLVPDHPRVTALPNGVDLEKFHPLGSAKEQLGLSGPTVLSVGNLIPLKGHDLVIRAVAKLADARLLIVGKGPMQEALLTLAQRLGLTDRVRFVPEVTQAELVKYYSAADVTVLASSNEGMPNVVLESLACGTPVIATRVGGIPEVLKEPDGGILLPTRSAEAVAAALGKLLANPPIPESVRATVRDRSWDRTTGELAKLFRTVCSSSIS